MTLDILNLLGSIHPLFCVLPLAVDRIFVRAVGDHFHALPVPGLFGAVLGNHVELADVVLQFIPHEHLTTFVRNSRSFLTSSTESGMHIRYSLVSMAAAERGPPTQEYFVPKAEDDALN